MFGYIEISFGIGVVVGGIGLFMVLRNNRPLTAKLFKLSDDVKDIVK